MLADLVDETGPATAAHLRQLAFAAAAENVERHRAFGNDFRGITSGAEEAEVVVANGGTTEAANDGGINKHDNDNGRSVKLAMGNDDSNGTGTGGGLADMLTNGDGSDINNKNNIKHKDDDPSVSSMVPEAVGELRDALSKMERLDDGGNAAAAAVNSGVRAIARTVMKRLAVIGRDIGSGDGDGGQMLLVGLDR